MNNMVVERQKANEFLTIRQVWLVAINDCRKAIGQRALPDVSFEKHDENIGERIIIDTVNAFYHTLVDYGEATIKSDVAEYFDKEYKPVAKALWGIKNMPVDKKYCDEVDLAIGLFDTILLILNKYNMLFEGFPDGYSNVIMEGVSDE